MEEKRKIIDLHGLSIFSKSFITFLKKIIPSKLSQLENDTGYLTESTANTTYELSKSGNTITLTGSDESESSETLTADDIGVYDKNEIDTKLQSKMTKLTFENIGFTNQTTLLEFCEACLKAESLFTAVKWINQSYQIHKDITDIIGNSNLYGDLEVLRNGGCVYFTWHMYNTGANYTWTYSTANNVGLSKIERYSGIDSAIPTFTAATSRTNIASKETIPVILGKISKYFTDLKTVAFSGSYEDLGNKPTPLSLGTVPIYNVNTLGGITATTTMEELYQLLFKKHSQGTWQFWRFVMWINTSHTTIQSYIAQKIGRESTTCGYFECFVCNGDTIFCTYYDYYNEYRYTWTRTRINNEHESADSAVITNNASAIKYKWTQATARTNIASGETLAITLGKIAKYFADLKTVAFTGSYTDLTNKPDSSLLAANINWSKMSVVADRGSYCYYIPSSAIGASANIATLSNRILIMFPNGSIVRLKELGYKSGSPYVAKNYVNLLPEKAVPSLCQYSGGNMGAGRAFSGDGTLDNHWQPSSSSISGMSIYYDIVNTDSLGYYISPIALA